MSKPNCNCWQSDDGHYFYRIHKPNDKVNGREYWQPDWIGCPHCRSVCAEEERLSLDIIGEINKRFNKIEKRLDSYNEEILKMWVKLSSWG